MGGTQNYNLYTSISSLRKRVPLVEVWLLRLIYFCLLKIMSIFMSKKTTIIIELEKFLMTQRRNAESLKR